MATPGLGEESPLHQLAPERAARWLLSRQLRHAEAAAQQLIGGEDPEALHDFRVALRRFRSIERAHRGWVAEALPKKLRKRLRELVQSTGPARDSEVQLGWLDRQRTVWGRFFDAVEDQIRSTSDAASSSTTRPPASTR